jgi:hypothetical protein
MADNIYTLINKVMQDVGAVKKAERNNHQNFNFRGIDAVINAVSPAFRQHGVFAYPVIISHEYDTVTVGQNRTQMGHARVVVKYVFCAPDGSSIEVTVPAESMDSGDKATAKAMSVAYRTALLQTLCLPTDDVDPDAETFVRSTTTNYQPLTRTAPQKSEQQSAAPERKKTGGDKLRTDAQANLMRQLLKALDAEEELIVDVFDTTIDQMPIGTAKMCIDRLLAVKRGDATVELDDDGRFQIT